MVDAAPAESGHPGWRAWWLWRWAPVLIPVVLVLVPGLAAGFLWYSNTSDLDIERTIEEPIGPGESMTVAVEDDGSGCGPVFQRLFRERLGRWQQTHTSADGRTWIRLERSLWSWGSYEEFSSLPCPIGGGGATLQLPDDVEWSAVVACDFDNEGCVRFKVDR